MRCRSVGGAHWVSLSFAAVVILAGLQTAAASVIGFGTNGTGWTFNGYWLDGTYHPEVAEDVLTLTNNLHQAGTAFFNTQQTITEFHATFTYKASNPINRWGDGMTFCLQRQGPTALGNAGGGLGYQSIAPSVAFALNLYDNGQYVGENLFVNGGLWGGYHPTDTITLWGNPILVTLDYENSVLNVDLRDLTTGGTYTTTYAVSIENLLGADTAYIGFTGGDWNAGMTQTISNFSFTSGTVPEPSTLAMFLGLGGMGLIAAYRRRKRSA